MYKSQYNRQGLIRLSPTTGLGLFRECPKCFWVHYNKRVQRPRGIFPSLPGGMDLVIKDYFDKYRGSLPPELKGKIKGSLMPDSDLMNKWRDWRTGLQYYDEKLNAELFGALDDCMVYNDKYVPLDYKTRGSAPRDGDSEKYYQTQLDTYALLIESSGRKIADFAYLVYYYPEEVSQNGMVKFNVKPVEIPVSSSRVKDLFEKAVNVLRGPMPEKHFGCEYCLWKSRALEFD